MQKKSMLLIIGALVIIAALIFLPQVFRGYTRNTVDKEVDCAVPAPFSLYSGKDIGFSFLYPSECEVGWEEDSACVYCDNGKLLISRMDKKNMSPKKYFKNCDKLMLSLFSSVESTPIQEVPVDGKTLYLTRYKVKYNEQTLIIDRYFESYRNFYLQYSSISSEADSLNTATYYAIKTLRTADKAYQGAYSEEMKKYSNDDVGISLRIPAMLTASDLTIGCICRNENCVLLSVLCNEDDYGNAIYNRQDFIDRAAENPDFVAGYLGADSAVFSEGQEVKLGGRSFYCYPMSMTVGDEEFSGQLCIANADETGVYLLCYGVRSGSPAADELALLCRSSLESINFS